MGFFVIIGYRWSRATVTDDVFKFTQIFIYFFILFHCACSLACLLSSSVVVVVVVASMI